jgi:phosphatidylethanolamine/phosphatidyl-N-methylethanolamine N-methyltransferase
MSDQPDLSATFYGTAAGLYDLVATAPGVRSGRRHTVETLDLSPGDTVVEMGCGTGANFPYLREQVGSDGTVVGVDLVPAMLRQARERVDRAGWENVHVVQGDATRPPVAEADALVSTFVVGMLADPAGAVREWLRCVAPGGRVTLLNAGRSPRPVALPLNLALRLFVRLSAPGRRLQFRSPTRDLEGRWSEARDALFEGTVDHREERLGAGLIPLVSGRVPDR